jgi:hypothetical protein
MQILYRVKLCDSIPCNTCQSQHEQITHCTVPSILTSSHKNREILHNVHHRDVSDEIQNWWVNTVHLAHCSLFSNDCSHYKSLLIQVKTHVIQSCPMRTQQKVHVIHLEYSENKNMCIVLIEMLHNLINILCAHVRLCVCCMERKPRYGPINETERNP